MKNKSFFYLDLSCAKKIKIHTYGETTSNFNGEFTMSLEKIENTLTYNIQIKEYIGQK